MNRDEIRAMIREELVAVLKNLARSSTAVWDYNTEMWGPPDMESVFHSAADELERRLT